MILFLAAAVGAAAVMAQSSDENGDNGTADVNENNHRWQLYSNGSRAWRWHHRAAGDNAQGPLARLRRSDLDRDQFLADALDITVEELHEARTEARTAGIQQAVEDEIISQEEADLLIGAIKLRSIINKDELLAAVLGVDGAELEAARVDGRLMRELLEESELDPADVRDGLRTAFEAAVDEAVRSGEITEEQAKQIIEFDGPRRLMERFRRSGIRW